MLKPSPNFDCYDYYKGSNSPNSLPKLYINDDCPYFDGVRIQRLIDEPSTDGKFYDKLLIYFNDHGKVNYCAVPTKELTSTKYPLNRTLIQYGLVLKEYHNHDASSILSDKAREFLRTDNIEYHHQRLGWANIQGCDCFLYDNNTRIGNNIIGYKNSICDREFTFQSGSQFKYEKMLVEIVYPSSKLTLAYVIGFAAIVAARLERAGIEDLGTIILNVSGKSSTGKSTMEQLLLSPFGSPNFNNKGLGITHSGTLNGILDALDGIQGLPRVIDDLTQNTRIDLTELVYTITQQEPKMRLGEQWKKNKGGWSGLVVVSSESPIIDQVRLQKGIYPRLINAKNIVWTDSPEQAETIKSIVRQNFGFTGRAFIDFMLQKDIYELSDEFRQMSRRVLNMMKEKDDLTKRISNKLTVIALTAELVQKCFGTPFQWTAEDLIQPLIDCEQETVLERDSAEKLLEIVRNYAHKYGNKYFDVIHDTWQHGKRISQSKVDAKVEHQGELVFLDDGQDTGNNRRGEIRIMNNVLKKIMRDEGFNDWESAASTLKERKILVGNKDKNGMRNDKKIGGIRYNCFILSEMPLSCETLDEVTAREQKEQEQQSNKRFPSQQTKRIVVEGK